MSDIRLQAMLEIEYFDPKWSFAKLWVVLPSCELFSGYLLKIAEMYKSGVLASALHHRY